MCVCVPVDPPIDSASLLHWLFGGWLGWEIMGQFFKESAVGWCWWGCCGLGRGFGTGAGGGWWGGAVGERMGV